MPRAAPFKARRGFQWLGKKVERGDPFNLDPSDPKAGMLLRGGYIVHHVPRQRRSASPEPAPVVEPVKADEPSDDDLLLAKPAPEPVDDPEADTTDD